MKHFSRIKKFEFYQKIIILKKKKTNVEVIIGLKEAWLKFAVFFLILSNQIYLLHKKI